MRTGMTTAEGIERFFLTVPSVRAHERARILMSAAGD
jgi:hypothetical protein